ncbi:MAG: DUF3500 domain-containing protein [Armatimonas sp.]
MKSFLPLLLVALPVLAFATLAPMGSPTTKTARAMQRAATRFLDGLTPAQKTRATFEFTNDERENFHFVPIERKGLPLSAMTPVQRTVAMDLIKTGLSKDGVDKLTTIMALEDVLKEIEKGTGPTRDREAYFVSIFGTPDAKAPWGWRVEGHHFSVNFTLKEGEISSTPIFFGSNPAEVRIEHPMKGTRVLKMEEEAGRSLLAALTQEQKSVAIIDAIAPGDIFSHEKRKITPLDNKGISAGKLDKNQAALLRKLMGVYATSMTAEIAKARLAKAEAAGFDKLVFAWAGSTERGQKHYYRVQGPTFLIEYDNTQNDANHIHSVWRDFDGDFGRDLLAEHIAADHTNP